MMDRRHNGWIVPALGIGLLGFALYGFNEHQQRSALVANALSGMQGDYHSLTYEVEEMQGDLAKALAVRAAAKQAGYLQEAGKRATAARVYAGRLPMNEWPDGTVMAFLDEVVKTTATDSENIIMRQQSTPSEQATLQTLNKGAKELSSQLRTAQSTILARAARPASVWGEPWHTATHSPVAPALSGAVHAAKPFILKAKPEASQRLSNKSAQQTLNRLAGQTVVGPAVAVERVRAFVGASGSTNGSLQPQVSRLAKNFGYKGYVVTLRQNNDAPLVYATVSLQGGHVMSLTRSPLNPSGHTWDLAQTQAAAEQFLHRQGYAGLMLQSALPYAKSVSYVYAPVSGAVALYDEPIRIKVNRGTGQVTAFDASVYWSAPKPTFSLRPRISEHSARQAISQTMATSHAQLAVVTDASSQPVLAYEFLGLMQGDTYRIDVSANTGQIIAIDKLSKVGDVS